MYLIILIRVFYGSYNMGFNIRNVYIYVCWFLYVLYVLINECDRKVLFLWYLI